MEEHYLILQLTLSDQEWILETHLSAWTPRVTIFMPSQHDQIVLGHDYLNIGQLKSLTVSLNINHRLWCDLTSGWKGLNAPWTEPRGSPGTDRPLKERVIRKKPHMGDGDATGCKWRRQRVCLSPRLSESLCWKMKSSLKTCRAIKVDLTLTF